MAESNQMKYCFVDNPPSWLSWICPKMGHIAAFSFGQNEPKSNTWVCVCVCVCKRERENMSFSFAYALIFFSGGESTMQNPQVTNKDYLHTKKEKAR